MLIRRSPAILAAVVAFLAYAITLRGTLIYDDVYVAREDARLASPRLWGGYFTQSYNGGVDNLYRPFVSMTYAVQHWLHGQTAWPYHLVNIGLHAIASALVALLGVAIVRRCGGADSIAKRVGAIAGLLFAVHPVHVEAVAGIVGRAESLCTVGSIGALLIAMSDRLTPTRVVAAWAVFTMALLSKEQAMLMPVVALAILFVARRPIAFATVTNADDAPIVPLDYRQPGTRRRRDPLASALFASVAATLAAYVVLREQVLHLKLWWDRGFLDPWIQPLAHANPIDRTVLGPLAIAGRYLILLVAPYRLHLDYGGPITPVHATAHEPLFWLGTVAVVVWVGWLCVAWRRGDRVSIAMLLAFAIVYGSIGNIVTIIGVNVADRLMYLPSVFFCVLAALPVARATIRWPRTTWTAIGLVLLLALARTETYAARWNERAGFYAYLLDQDPRSVKAALLCLAESLEQKQPERAVAYGRRAVAIAPGDEDAYLWLGKALIANREFDAAADVLRQGEKIRPGGPSSQMLRDLEAMPRESTR